LYSGYKATIVRDLPFSAFQFAFYEQERAYAMQWLGTKDLNLGMEIATALTAGGAAGVLTCPLDVVKTRTQTQVTSDDHAKSSQASHMEKRSKKATSTQTRGLHSSPRTVPTTAPTLDTSSVIHGLRLIYKTEGVAGWFRGVGPRFVWTGVQTTTMLVLYQYLLKHFGNIASSEGPTL
jgi:hypothetical protein